MQLPQSLKVTAKVAVTVLPLGGILQVTFSGPGSASGVQVFCPMIGLLKPKYTRSITSPDCLTLAITQPFSLLPKIPLPAVDHIICVPPSAKVGRLVNIPSLIAS